MTSFSTTFQRATGFSPWSWQRELGDQSACSDRLVRIPTGFGKTAGAVLTWAHHRLELDDPTWPNRLVLVLPMRVLVEQTLSCVRTWLDELGHADVQVTPLMGGAWDGGWALQPERPAVLVGTQDMLLSRGLNRGYGASRGRWPMDFGLLHHDALWVFDEIQLMDVGLATSTQLAAFRHQDLEASLRPTYTWWMSATLQPRWLAVSDCRPHAPQLAQEMLTIPESERSGGLWTVTKPVERRADLTTPEAIAAEVADRHEPGTLTLVMANRVADAVSLHQALSRVSDADLELVHSRFRGAERASWREGFLSREAEVPEVGRIIVATQVVEAGVDISARLLVTALAPWASLVQRFGRAGRYRGEHAEVLVVGATPEADKDALPYSAPELAAADRGLRHLIERGADAAPAALDHLEAHLAAEEPELLAALYPYDPLHVVRRPDLEELFDTAPDLSGADLDIDHFIRTGVDRDVRVFWEEIGEGEEPGAAIARPHRDALCPVPIGALRKWLEKRTGWLFDYLDGTWRKTKARDVVPGMVLLLRAADGGYDPRVGWTSSGRKPVSVVTAPVPTIAVELLDRLAGFEGSAEAADGDALSHDTFKSIATHCRETADAARGLATALELPDHVGDLLELAARWHDVGKAHPVFQGAISAEARGELAAPARQDLAKAPRTAWGRYERRGFRHELASALGLFDLLRRSRPDHPALAVDPEVLEILGLEPAPAPADLEDHTLGKEIAALGGEDFDLLVYLVVSHHGKVRCSWSPTPHDGPEMVHGVRSGDALGELDQHDRGGGLHALPPLQLDLAPAGMGLHPVFGRSWTDRMARLLRTHGPFRLAFLEALLRAADVRASKLSTRDPRCQ